MVNQVLVVVVVEVMVRLGIDLSCVVMDVVDVIDVVDVVDVVDEVVVEIEIETEVAM